MRVPKRTSIGVIPYQNALRDPQSVAVPGAFGEQVGPALANLAGQTMALGAFIKEQEDQKLKFTALKAFTEFETKQRLALTEASRNAVPGDPAFYESQFTAFKAQEKEFLASLPPDLQDEFSVRTTALGGDLGLAAAKFQYEANDLYFKEGIQNVVDQARNEIGQDGSKDNLEKQRARVDEVIAASGLSTAEQEATRRKAHADLESVAYRNAQLERLRSENAGTASDVEQATALLISLGDIPEQEAADQALQAAQEASALFGSLDKWAALPSRVRSALVMAQATTGIPQAAIAALANGDLDALATALRDSGNEVAGDLINNPESGIDNDPAFANVAYEDRLSLLADAQRQLVGEVTAANEAATAANAALVEDLMLGIHDGLYGQAEIDRVRELGKLDYNALVRAEKALEDRDSAAQLKLLGQQMLAGGVTFAPGNEDHAKALNAVVGEEGLKALEAHDGEYVAGALIPIVRQAGAVPSDVVDLLRGMIRKDSQTAYWALDLMSQIKRTDEKAFSSFPEEDQKTLDFWEARRDYIPQEEMIKAINGPMDTGERAGRAELRKQGMELLTSDPVMKDFDPVTLFDQGWFGGGMPTISGVSWAEPQLNADFQTLFLDAYELSGNADYAKEAAKKQLQRVWGVTRTGADNKLMRYPPERVYPPVRGSHDWMEAQLRRDGIIGEGEQFQLLSDDQTETEWRTGAPSYVLVKEIEGRIEIPRGEDGRYIRVNFDYGLEEQTDESKWREEQRIEQDAVEAQKLFGAALQHELDTGTRMPDSLLEMDQPGGKLDRLLYGDPAELTEEELNTRMRLLGGGGL